MAAARKAFAELNHPHLEDDYPLSDDQLSDDALAPHTPAIEDAPMNDELSGVPQSHYAKRFFADGGSRSRVHSFSAIAPRDTH